MRSFFSSPRFQLAFGAVLCLAFLNGAAVAQQATAQIAGTVKDQSGAVVPGATVTLKNSNTNIARATTASKDGDYLFTSIPIGSYQVMVEQQGFRKYERKGITLEINQNAKLDVTLQVGATSQVVEVQGDVSQVDTVSATLGKVETTQRILDLPLVERDTLQLGLLQAGVFAPDQDDGSGNPFSVSGQRSESMTFLIDGADNNDSLGNNFVVDPNPDAVAEFKILTNNYTAEYGRTSGGIVNQVIKSGTNSVHGSVFEFFRNTDLDASDYFLQSVPVLKRNLFGATIGFPIKKNKAFFFASYQGTRRREGQLNQVQVPTLAERSGDFSSLLSQGIQLVNPTTGSNYPNNQVLVDPVIQNYITKYLPLPNQGGNTFIGDPVANIREDQFIFRFDYTLSSKDTLSAVYLFNDSPDVYPYEVINGGTTGGDIPLGSGFSDANRAQTGSLTWTRTISPTILNELRFATNRTATLQAVPTDKTSPQALGFTNVNPDDPAGVAPPVLQVNGEFNVGPSPQGPTKIHDVTFQYQDTLSWTHGRHDLKFGADLHWVQNNFHYDFDNQGVFAFGQGTPFTNNALADFVGGFWDNYQQFAKAIYGIRSHSWHVFGQDAWKLTKNLTLDYGLRYEYNSPQQDPTNQILGYFPGQQSTVFPNAPPNILYPNDPGTPNRGLVYPNRKNFAPRFGFAWDMLGNAKLVMRGGFGIFYDIEDGALNLQFGGEPPFGAVTDNTISSFSGVSGTPIQGNTNLSYVADPFGEVVQQNPFPFHGPVGAFQVPALSGVSVVYPHFRTPYAQNFNYGFQYQLSKDTMIEAVYVGSLSRRAVNDTDLNFPTMQGPNGLIAQYNYYSQTGNPLNDINPDCSRPLAACTGALPGQPAFTGSPTQIVQLLTNVSEGSSSSNQFQLTVDKRLSHGIQFRVAYTVAKTIDTQSGYRSRSSVYTNSYDPALDRGLADFDAPQRLVLSPIWEIPWDKPFRGNSFARKITEGWSVSTIASFQSGNPFTLFSNNNSSFSNNFLDRPDVIGPIQVYSNPRQQRTFSPDQDGIHGSCLSGTQTGNFLFNPTNLVCALGGAFGVPGGVAPLTFGNMGRNVLRGPGINNWDFSLAKDFKFTESKSLEFRTEFFNAFNHTQFLSPTFQNGSEGSGGSFGQITSDRGPRIIQFAMKLYY